MQLEELAIGNLGDSFVASVGMKLEGVVIPVAGVEAARAELLAGGVAVTEVFHPGTRGAQLQPEGSPGRIDGPEPNRARYGPYATFRNPEGDLGLLQEVTSRPGRLDSPTPTFASANDLARATRRAAAAHGEHETRIGQPEPNWPDCYTSHMVA